MEGLQKAELAYFNPNEEYLDAAVVVLEEPEEKLPEDVEEAMRGQCRKH